MCFYRANSVQGLSEGLPGGEGREEEGLFHPSKQGDKVIITAVTY